MLAPSGGGMNCQYLARKQSESNTVRTRMSDQDAKDLKAEAMRKSCLSLLLVKHSFIPQCQSSIDVNCPEGLITFWNWMAARLSWGLELLDSI
ncbi:hypothetical protein Tco_0605267 [Tanacetum coccineum]